MFSVCKCLILPYFISVLLSVNYALCWPKESHFPIKFYNKVNNEIKTGFIPSNMIYLFTRNKLWKPYNLNFDWIRVLKLFPALKSVAYYWSLIFVNNLKFSGIIYVQIKTNLGRYMLLVSVSRELIIEISFSNYQNLKQIFLITIQQS